MTLFPTRVLVAADGSEEAQLAARAAIQVSNETGSELRLVHAGEPGGLSLSYRAPNVEKKVYFPPEAVEEFEKRARELLEEQVGKIEKAGPPVPEPTSGRGGRSPRSSTWARSSVLGSRSWAAGVIGGIKRLRARRPPRSPLRLGNP